MNVPESHSTRRVRRALPESAGWILLALADGPQSGATLRGQIIDDTLGEYVPDTTLYRILERLAGDGLVELDQVSGIFRLTASGRDYVRRKGADWLRWGHLARARLR